MTARTAAAVDDAQALRRRLALRPDDDAAATEYGRLSLAAGAGDAAATWLGAAAAIVPSSPELAPLLSALGHAYLAAGLVDPAARMLRRAVAADGEDWRGWNDYGVVQDRRGKPADAQAAVRAAVALAPSAAPALSNLADLLFRSGAFGTAAAMAARSADDADALATGGNAELRLGRATAAERRFRRSLALAPAAIASLSGLGTAFMTEESVAPAGRWWHRAASVRPDDIASHNNLATWHLTRGDLRRGFDFYEWRWLRPEARQRRAGAPEWRGEPISGRRILLYQEQGLGDALQMARYVPELAAQGAVVDVECDDALRRLFRSLPGVNDIVATGQPSPAEVQAPLMSLPRLLGTTLDTVPRRIPYLAPEPGLVREVASLFGPSRPRVGVVWQGNPRQVDEPHRSVPLAVMKAAFAAPGVTFYGLQRDHGRERMDLVRGQRNFVDLGPRLDDLATTAAVMAHLDLVISPCTALAHLAGALGRPVWILLKRGPDWRWMLERSDSPWYPTATLIRQRRAGDWPEVMRRVIEMLRAGSE